MQHWLLPGKAGVNRVAHDVLVDRQACFPVTCYPLTSCGRFAAFKVGSVIHFPVGLV